MSAMRFLSAPLFVTALLLTALPAFAAKAPATKGPAAPAKSLLADVDLFLISTPHSLIEFGVTWMGISRVRGTFDDFVGTIAVDRQDLTRSSVSLIVRTKSLSTGDERRDRDLKGADWFDVEKYPEATFRSTAIVQDGDRYRLRGTLSLRGNSREVEIPFTFNGRIHGRGSGLPETRVGFEGRLTLSRKEWGLVGPQRFNVLTEVGKAMVGDPIDLTLAVEGWRAGVPDTLPHPPADSLARRVASKGFATVAREYRAALAATPDSLMAVDEGVLNSVAYALLYRGQTADALALFRLEAETHPQTVFALVGLTQTYATMGDRENAIASGEKAVALNPSALRAVEILRQIRSRTAP
jgi:polyisoprenoid-binding protein YceI